MPQRCIALPLQSIEMPFNLNDLDRLTVRVGMSEKRLRELTDTQFGAWLRSIGAQGTINYSQPRAGQLDIAVEERVRILDELEASGFHIPGIMGSAETPDDGERGPDRPELAQLKQALDQAAAGVDVARGLAQRTGEVDPRINLRQSLDGAMALLDAARGAVERALRQLQG
jgi:hypothetical protein